MQDGVGNCLIAVNFFSSGLIPVSEIMCPANSISFPISNFLRDIAILFILHLSRTVHVLMTSSMFAPWLADVAVAMAILVLSIVFMLALASSSSAPATVVDRYSRGSSEFFLDS